MIEFFKMMTAVNLDMDALRTLATAMELGSFARAAERLGRSPSALSLQMRKLEGQLGQRLLRKNGRGLVLTEAGEAALRRAVAILALNDALVASLSAPSLTGVARLGMPRDYAETRLPGILARFIAAHPGVVVEAVEDRSTVLAERVARRDLDMALINRPMGTPPEGFARLLRRSPVRWIAPIGWAFRAGEPLSLALLDNPCPFRDMALRALDAAGVPWRIAFTGGGPAGLWAAVSAGLGVTARGLEGAPPDLDAVTPARMLPPLPEVALWAVAWRRLEGAGSGPRGARESAAARALWETMVAALADGSASEP